MAEKRKLICILSHTNKMFELFVIQNYWCSEHFKRTCLGLLGIRRFREIKIKQFILYSFSSFNISNKMCKFVKEIWTQLFFYVFFYFFMFGWGRKSTYFEIPCSMFLVIWLLRVHRKKKKTLIAFPTVNAGARHLTVSSTNLIVVMRYFKVISTFLPHTNGPVGTLFCLVAGYYNRFMSLEQLSYPVLSKTPEPPFFLFVLLSIMLEFWSQTLRFFF